MFRRFEKLFVDPPDKVVIAFGDWEQKQHRKFKESTKGKRFRDLFRKTGHTVYLVDEFRASARCSGCEKGVCVSSSEYAKIPESIVMDVSYAMVLSSVRLVEGFGTETQMQQAISGR